VTCAELDQVLGTNSNYERVRDSLLTRLSVKVATKEDEREDSNDWDDSCVVLIESFRTAT